MHHLSVILLCGLTAMVAVFWIYFKMLNVAHAKDLVDNPGARKLQKRPVPVVGGLCVLFGVICAVLVGSCLMDCSKLVPILMAMVVMTGVGALDDFEGLTAKIRLVIEILIVLALIYGGGGCIDSLHGTWGIEHFSWYVGVPFTVFACVGIINAINMIDGVNGLSSGLCFTCSLLFAYVFYRGQDWQHAMLCLSMAAGLFPFLLHNVIGKTSKMFLGDAGTMMMGVLMAWCVMQVLRSDSTSSWVGAQHRGMNVVALTLAILSVPVFDTVRVMLLRIIQGRSPFSADKTHLHHLFYTYSQSHSLSSLGEIFLNLFICLCLVIAYWLQWSLDVQLYVVIAASIFFVWGTYFFLSRNYQQKTGIAFRLHRRLVEARQGDTLWWNKAQEWIDTPRQGFFKTKGESAIERKKTPKGSGV